MRVKTSGGNSNRCTIQKQTKLARYRISKPPRMMRNIAKYYTNKIDRIDRY